MPCLKGSIDCERLSGLISILSTLNHNQSTGSSSGSTTAYLQISDLGIRCSLSPHADTPPKLATIFLSAQEHFCTYTFQATASEFTIKKSLQELLHALGYIQDIVSKSQNLTYGTNSIAPAEKRNLHAATIIDLEICSKEQWLLLELSSLTLPTNCCMNCRVKVQGEAILQDLTFLVAHPFDAELSAKAIVNSKLVGSCFGSNSSTAGFSLSPGSHSTAAEGDSEFEWRFGVGGKLELVSTSPFHRSEYAISTENVDLCEYYECTVDCQFKISGKRFAEFKQVLKLSSKASISVFGGGVAMIVQLMVPMSSKCNVFVEYYL